MEQEKKNKTELLRIPQYQMETKNYTLSKYDFSAIQQNVITLIQEQLKPFMTKDAQEAVIRLDSLGEPYVVINCDEAGGEKNKKKVIAEVKKMFSKTLEFRWRDEKWGKNIKTCCPMVTAIHDIQGTNTVKVNYNKWALPFFVYYGKGVGGTVYDKTLALTLDGKYTKRIYKLICSYRSKSKYEYNLEKFREDFGVPKSYTPNKIKVQILDKAQADIDATDSDVKFEWEYIMEKEGKKKPKAVGIRFFPKWKKSRENMTDKEQKLYNQVYMIVGRIGVQQDKVVAVADLCLEKQLMQLVIDKYNFYDDCICNGMRMADGTPYNTTIIGNILKKLIRQELEKKGVDPRKMPFLYPKKEKTLFD